MNFENGKISWLETHFEVVSGINKALNAEGDNTAKERSEKQGTGGLYELSEELTDEFEKSHKDRNWDGDFFDEIERFITSKLY